MGARWHFPDAYYHRRNWRQKSVRMYCAKEVVMNLVISVVVQAAITGPTRRAIVYANTVHSHSIQKQQVKITDSMIVGQESEMVH